MDVTTTLVKAMIPRSIECQRCLHRNPAEANFCSVCGHSVAWEPLCEADIALRRAALAIKPAGAAGDHAWAAYSAATAGSTFRDSVLIALMVFSTLFVLTCAAIPFLALLL